MPSIEMRKLPGVSLVEFIVAVGLLALVFTVMFELLPYSHVVDHEAWDLAAAQDLAHTRLEAARAYQIDYLAYAPPSGTYTAQPANIVYNWTMNAVPYPTPPVACPPCSSPRINLELVTFKVRWTETGFSSAGVGGIPKQLVLQTLVSRTLPASNAP